MKAQALVFLLLAVASGGCQAQEAVSTEVATASSNNTKLLSPLFDVLDQSAWGIISSDPQLSVLADLIRGLNLVPVIRLAPLGTTVLAPTNDALNAFIQPLPTGTPTTGQLVRNIITQHVIPRVLVLPLITNVRYATLNLGNFVTRTSATTFTGGQLNGPVANQVGTPIRKLRGLVIKIDNVLLPNNAFADLASILTYYQLSSLSDAVNLDPATIASLDDPSLQKTLFAPTNTAFTNAGPIDNAAIPDVLSYHTAPAIYTVSWPFLSRTINTLLDGQTLVLRLQNRISDSTSTLATVITRNIFFPGGVVQIINKVLISAP